MKVLFIFPDYNYITDIMIDEEYKGSYHMGLAMLSACAKKYGHETKLLHILGEINVEELIKNIKRYNPNLICYTAYSNQFDKIEKIAPIIKREFPNVITVFGGVHATIDSERVLKKEGIDIISIGEAEEAFTELCNKLANKQDYTRIDGLWIKKDGQIYRNPIRHLSDNLDELPFPDRELFDFNNLVQAKIKKLNVITTRGCPFTCTYCSEPQYQELYKGKGPFVRMRSVNNVIAELKECIKKYPYMDHVELLDDTFGLNKTWLKEFSEKYSKEIGLPLMANTRVDLVNFETVKYLKKANFIELCMGVESGNEELREKILKRITPTEKIQESFDACNKYNIKTRAYVIVGLPYETLSNIIETIKLCARIKATSIHLSVWQPYPNTELYNVAIKEGWITEDTAKFGTYFDENIVKQKSISPETVLFSYRYFRIFMRLYQIFGENNKLIDRIFLNEKLHKPLLKILPLSNLIVFPLKTPYKSLYKNFPGFTRIIKKNIINNIRLGKKIIIEPLDIIKNRSMADFYY